MKNIITTNNYDEGMEHIKQYIITKTTRIKGETKMSKILNKLLTSKFFIRLFLLLIAIIICQKICGVAYISDTMALGAMGFVAGLIALYNNDKHKMQP